ncbi:MAG: ASPIC/UnbV domain-containing protein [Pyrinomonadaceae bacterium]
MLNARPLVLRNNGTKNNWLKVTFKSAARSNSSALGARLTATDSTGRSQTFDVTGAGSYLSSNDWRIHIGLGAAPKIERLDVRWPNGNRERFKPTNVNQSLTLTEGTGSEIK